MHYLHEPEERKEEKFRLQEQQKMMKNSQSISQHLERKKWKKKEKGKKWNSFCWYYFTFAFFIRQMADTEIEWNNIWFRLELYFNFPGL